MLIIGFKYKVRGFFRLISFFLRVGGFVFVGLFSFGLFIFTNLYVYVSFIFSIRIYFLSFFRVVVLGLLYDLRCGGRGLVGFILNLFR